MKNTIVGFSAFIDFVKFFIYNLEATSI
jgi:hypothetical protein